MNKYLSIIKTRVIAFVPYYLSRLLFCFCHINENKFFFVSMGGTNYGDNMKSMSDYVSANHSNAIIVWGFNKDTYDRIECDHIKVRFYTFRYYYHQFTSKYFIINEGTSKFTYTKRKGHVKVQTWHGTALKRIGKDSKTQDHPKWLLPFKPKALKSELKEADIFISGSRFMTNVYRQAYDYQRKIYETGTPRNDIFFHQRNDIIEKVKRMLGINIDNKIILYAPTFRNDRNFTYYDVDLSLIRQFFEKKWENQCTVLIRLHPNMIGLADQFVAYHPNTVDATSYPDMQELLYTTDLLITDYSSTAFDIMYSYKPVILYVPDRNTYNRGFYFDIDKLPFLVVNNNKEILDVLSTYDERTYKDRINSFLQEIGSVEDGNAAKHVYELMMKFPNI